MNLKEQLLRWYHLNHRKLPFRETHDPYHIWISEIMAQQTQIDTMIPYYQKWLERFPTITSVAEADEMDILKAWEGLGYYRRVRNIQSAAKIIQHLFNGQFPTEYSDVLSLPGIGEYTAGAICSIAYNTPVVAIDGNVIRVITRLFGISDDVGKKTTIESIKSRIIPYLDDNNNRYLTQAWMEMGALVCTPKQPKCKDCPLKEHCYANKHDLQSDLPNITKKITQKTEEFDVFLNFNNETINVSYDDSDGLMKGMIRLPQVPKQKRSVKPVLSLKHVYSHKVWIMNVYVNQFHCEEMKDTIHINEIKKVPFITAHKKIIALLLKSD